VDDRYSAMRKEILVCAAEDLTGVWEAWFQANATFPELPISERVALAERALRDLYGDGLITFYRGTWAENDQQEIAGEDAAAALREYDAWVPPNNRPTVFFLATSAGSSAAGLPPL
jgi:hypothetical protein